jgi:Spy/CpxP family protein refolding chaperone
MKRFILWSSVFIVLVAAGIALARANSFMRHRWGHYGGPLGYVGRELDLSATQKSQIRSIWQGEKPTVAALVRELNAESKEMDQATAGGNLDEGKVQEIAGRQGSTVAKLLVEKEKLTSQIYTNVLNADQRTKADRLQERWHSRLDRLAARLEQTSD